MNTVSDRKNSARAGGEDANLRSEEAAITFTLLHTEMKTTALDHKELLFSGQHLGSFDKYPFPLLGNNFKELRD